MSSYGFVLGARSDFQVDDQRDQVSSLVAHWFSTCANCHVKARAIPFTQYCPRLSEETLKVVGPFHLVSASEEVNRPHAGGKWTELVTDSLSNI